MPQAELPLEVQPEIEISSTRNLTPEARDMLSSVALSFLPGLIRDETAKAEERALGLSIVPEKEVIDLIRFIEQAEVLPSTFE